MSSAACAPTRAPCGVEHIRCQQGDACLTASTITGMAATVTGGIQAVQGHGSWSSVALDAVCTGLGAAGRAAIGKGASLIESGQAGLAAGSLRATILGGALSQLAPSCSLAEPGST
jgi:hypothetical protein